MSMSERFTVSHVEEVPPTQTRLGYGASGSPVAGWSEGSPAA